MQHTRHPSTATVHKKKQNEKLRTLCISFSSVQFIYHELKGPIKSILVNQKPMIPRSHFHCITTWVARSSG